MLRFAQGIHKAFRSNQAYAPCQKVAQDQDDFEPKLGGDLLGLQRKSFCGYPSVPLSQPLPRRSLTEAALNAQEQKTSDHTSTNSNESNWQGYSFIQTLIPGAVFGTGYAILNSLHAYCSGRRGDASNANDRSKYCPKTQYRNLQRSSVLFRSLTNLLPGSYDINPGFNVLPKTARKPPDKISIRNEQTGTLSIASSNVAEASSSHGQEFENARIKVDRITDELRNIDKDNLAADHFLALRAWGDKNFAGAAQLWQRTVEKIATPVAAHRLGICYEHGHGVTQSYQLASEYYRLAITHNCRQAMFRQAMLQMRGHIEDEQTDTMELIKKSAELNYSKAQTFLGSFHFHNEDKRLAVKYFEKAASQNDAEACYYMGVCHELGAGVGAADDNKAADFYKKAAEGGHHDAQYNLSVFYEEGYGGLECDQERAIYWLTESSKQGNSHARQRLQQLGHWSIKPSVSLPAIGKFLPNALSDMDIQGIMRTRSDNVLPNIPAPPPPAASTDIVKALSRASSSSSVAGTPRFYIPAEDDEDDDMSTFESWSADEGLSTGSSSASLCLDKHSDKFSVEFSMENMSYVQESPPLYSSNTVSWSSGDSLYKPEHDGPQVIFT